MVSCTYDFKGLSYFCDLLLLKAKATVTNYMRFYGADATDFR